VQPYRETTPLFARFGIESQLDKMLQPQVTLKSGGYIIINQTEALVAIDVNSGRSTKEHSIEETALHTNLEAAEEVARQLRLRDLAGLIVIDFIDMEENRNNRAVEKRLKDHLKNDRARIQLGRISHFGLMEMSRQRIRASVLESTMKPCPHCGGTGHVRSDSSVALLVVRAIEEFLLKDSRCHITVRTPSSIALYVLNHKRGTLAELEARFGLTITVEVDETVGAQHYAITRGAVAEKPQGFQERQALPPPDEDEDDDIVVEAEADEAPAADRNAQQQQRHGEATDEGGRKRRRRRRRRGGRDRDNDREQNGASHEDAPEPNDGLTEQASEEGAIDDGADADAVAAVADAVADDAEEGPAKKRRRGKRGGKRNRREGDDEQAETGDASASESGVAVTSTEAIVTEDVAEAGVADLAVEDSEAKEPPKKARRAPRSKKAAAAAATDEAADSAGQSPAVEPESAPKPAAGNEDEPARRSSRKPSSGEPSPAVVSSETPEDQAGAADQPKRSGWWQKRSFF
jgi:ribonuclease E